MLGSSISAINETATSRRDERRSFIKAVMVKKKILLTDATHLLQRTKFRRLRTTRPPRYRYRYWYSYTHDCLLLERERRERQKELVQFANCTKFQIVFHHKHTPRKLLFPKLLIQNPGHSKRSVRAKTALGTPFIRQQKHPKQNTVTTQEHHSAVNRCADIATHYAYKWEHQGFSR